MTTAQEISPVIWIKSIKTQPICDVPWRGTAVVLSDGNVNFCCYSNVVVGNVKQQSFEQIWNGKTMQRIRQVLSRRQLPPECHSTSCPIYRGDKVHFIFDRMDGSDQTIVERDYPSPAQSAKQLGSSTLKLTKQETRIGDSCEFTVALRWHGKPGLADLFICIEQPGHNYHFLPNYENYAVPFLCDITLSDDAVLEKKGRIRGEYLQFKGTYRVCAALFAPESNPNLSANCYWSETREFAIK